MERTATNDTIRQIRVLHSLGAVSGLADSELLSHFLSGVAPEAEDAFRALVERHGPMILGVCRRALRDHHAAEDAFQATFLVLARRAASVSRYENLANWLYGVAIRTAKEARRREARRVRRETALRNTRRVRSAPEQEQVDLLSVLDEELSRLPGRYRAALLACELAGKSRADAARQLGVPEGTLSSDLARGRKLLRERLNRRGITWGFCPLGALGQEAFVSAVPVTLATSTARIAVSALSGMASNGSVPASVALLMHAVRRTMFMTRLTISTVAGATLGVAALSCVLLAGSAGIPLLGVQQEGKPRSEPHVSSSIDGDTLRMNIDIPLNRVNPDTVILRGQGRQVEIAVAPRVIRRLEGHNGPVSAVAVAPDGKTILSASGWPQGDRTIRLWDVATGSEIRRFLSDETDPGPGTRGPREAPGEVRAIAFTPDGKQALSGSTGGILQLWDLETGKEIRRFLGHKGTIYALAIAPDGRRALTGSRDKTARLWDLATGNQIELLQGHTGWVRSVAFSRDGRRALTGAGPHDFTVRLWDLENHGKMRMLPQHGGIATGVAFTPDGRHALAAINAETEGETCSFRLWDLERDVDTHRFKDHDFAVTSLAISPDGQQFLTSSYDGAIRLWDIASGRQLSLLTDHREWVWAVAYGPRGDFAVSAGGGGAVPIRPPGRDFALRLWNLSIGTEIKSDNSRPPH